MGWRSGQSNVPTDKPKDKLFKPICLSPKLSVDAEQLRPFRHGWGIPVNTTRAITFLSQAASNSAAIESEALSAGMKKGGAAKGELVLAMYELANSFRHGWGVDKDPAAARSYYETAANLGDTDAMNEVARCYEEGFGGKKDKVSGSFGFWAGSSHLRV